MRIRTALRAALPIVLALGAAPALAVPPVEGMVRVRLSTGLVEGRPLAWDSRQVFLLARDGQLVTFAPGGARDMQPSAPRFVGYTLSEMRSRLHAEFGRDFDVAATQHYLVVHPRGDNDKWAERFEELYRSFYHYFQVRGFKLREPGVSLVAVVFATRDEYHKYSAARGMQLSAGYLGHYSSHTNRVYLFDTVSESPRGDWSQNAELIIHEATHQTAYNAGVHSRFTGTPRWVSEGLATMFEARGVWDSSRYRSQGDRLNRARLAEFRTLLARRPEAWFAALIRSDDAFQASPQGAYAEAWAFSFFLCETQPRLYAKYLARTAAGQEFAQITADERLADFTAIFGDNLKLLDAQFLRFAEKLR